MSLNKNNCNKNNKQTHKNQTEESRYATSGNDFFLLRRGGSVVHLQTSKTFVVFNSRNIDLGAKVRKGFETHLGLYY